MKAAVYEAFGAPLTIQNVPDPAPPPDGVVVRTEANGICRSDWHGWVGHDPDIELPHVPGHELAGVIEAVGPNVTRFQVGDRVTVPFAVGCGTCPQCVSGWAHVPPIRDNSYSHARQQRRHDTAHIRHVGSALPGNCRQLLYYTR